MQGPSRSSASQFNNLPENTVVGKRLVLLFPGLVRHTPEGEVVAVKEVTVMQFYPRALIIARFWRLIVLNPSSLKLRTSFSFTIYPFLDGV
jgi:hypothetical protein